MSPFLASFLCLLLLQVAATTSSWVRSCTRACVGAAWTLRCLRVSVIFPSHPFIVSSLVCLAELSPLTAFRLERSVVPPPPLPSFKIRCHGKSSKHRSAFTLFTAIHRTQCLSRPAEVRLSWYLLSLLSTSCALARYQATGAVELGLVYFVAAQFLYTNATAKVSSLTQTPLPRCVALS